MPCVEDLSPPEVQKDIEFWKFYEKSLHDSYWCYIIPLGYAIFLYSIISRFGMGKLEFNRQVFIVLKFGVVISFIGSYISIPLFFWFEKLRVVFFLIHLFSLHGLVTTILLSRQSDDNYVSVSSDESLGFGRSMKLGAALIVVQLANIWFSSQEKFYECPPSWIVELENWMFKGLVCCHSLSYIMIKGAWISWRAEKLEISNNDKVVAFLVKRGEDWVREDKKNE